jgi:hypothetical protein
VSTAAAAAQIQIRNCGRHLACASMCVRKLECAKMCIGLWYAREMLRVCICSCGVGEATEKWREMTMNNKRMKLERRRGVLIDVYMC